MSRLGVLLLVSGVGALLTGGSVFACTAPHPVPEATAVPAGSAAAMSLLESAAIVARTRSWTGTQSIVSTRAGEPSFSLLEVTHTPGTGMQIQAMAENASAVSPDLIDDTLFSLLVSHYDLSMAGTVLCHGHRAALVEARRPGITGVDGIAAKFWIDRATGMLLRRDVLAENGSVLRSSQFLSLHVGAGARKVVPVAAASSTTAGEQLDDDQVRDLISSGWPIVEHLPSGLELFDTRLLEQNGHDVVQLSYSDGISTLSLFAQQGTLPASTGGSMRVVGTSLVHETGSSPEQLVWSGGGRTWTLVSDATQTSIDEAVMVLPHADPPVKHDGMTGRVWRGMSRVGGWLNPFD